MQLVDANVLLYAVGEESPHHEQSRAWLDDAFAQATTLAFTWIVLLAFMRLSTSPVFPNPLSVEEAVEIAEGWLGEPVAAIIEPTSRHLAVVERLLDAAGTAGNLVNDAHLAALALEHGAEVISFDRDFGRFEGVRWRLPG